MIKGFKMLLLAVVVAAAANAAAAAYPDRPINLVVPAAPGDATDIAARVMAEELAKLVKVPVLVINKPGAGGILGADSVVKAAKDGYTLLFTINASLTSNRILNPETAGYDPIRDLTPLGLTTRTPMVIAVRGNSFKTFKDMLAEAKKNPGKINIGTAGLGSIGDFAVQIINARTGVEMVSVPFKGGAPSVTAVQGGHVEASAAALGLVAGHIKAGTMRGLLASTKSPQFPDIPTMKELGFGEDFLGVWLAFFAPAGVPEEVGKVLVPAIATVALDPMVVEKLAAHGVIQDYQPPAKLTAEIAAETRTLQQIVDKAKAKP